MSHNLNHITLELNAATELVDRGEFATVFAIHNRYIGKNDKQEPQERAMPIGVLFGANTLKRAKRHVAKGSRFVVTGVLDYDSKKGPDGDKEFYTIRADSFTPVPKAAVAEDAGDEDARNARRPARASR